MMKDIHREFQRQIEAGWQAMARRHDANLSPHVLASHRHSYLLGVVHTAMALGFTRFARHILESADTEITKLIGD